MFSRFQRFFIFFFNLTVITSIRLENGCFKLSYLTFVKNLLFLPVFQFLIMWNSSIPKSFHEATKSKDSEDLTAHTVFFQIMFYCLMIVYRFAVIYIVYMQLFCQKKLIGFLNNCRQLIKDYNLEEECEKFEKKYLKALAGSYTVLFACYSVEFVAIFTPTWKGVLDAILFHVHGFIIFTCYGFFGFCLHFIHFLFVKVAHNLKESRNFDYFADHGRNWNQIRDVLRLVQEFNQTYAHFISITTFSTVATLTIKVSTRIKHILLI